jgi:hypothetical protein
MRVTYINYSPANGTPQDVTGKSVDELIATEDIEE